MAIYVGLLRAINLGSHNKVSMADLRALLAELGMKNPHSLLQSEVVKARGRHAYFLYPNGIGRSRLTMTLIEKKLGTTGTARNWNTVLKLGALTEKA